MQKGVQAEQHSLGYSHVLRDPISRSYILMASSARVVEVASPVIGRCCVRSDVVVLLEGAPNSGHEPAGSGEHVREVHVLEVRLWVTPGHISS